MSKFKTVHRPRHIDVRKHNPYVFTCLQNSDCFVCVGRFHRDVASVFNEVDGVQSVEEVVFDQPTGIISFSGRSKESGTPGAAACSVSREGLDPVYGASFGSGDYHLIVELFAYVVAI
jgi:hypothetical protein